MDQIFTRKHAVKWAGKRALVRSDLFINADSAKDSQKDPFFAGSLTVIRTLLDAGVMPVVFSHIGDIGRVKKAREPYGERFDLLRKLLAESLNADIYLAAKPDDIRNRPFRQREVVLFENMWSFPEELSRDMDWAKELMPCGEVWIQDAMSIQHRDLASTSGMRELGPVIVGPYIAEQMRAIDNVVRFPSRPFAALVGGSDVEDKISALENLIRRFNTILIGGPLAYTFLKAKALPVGDSPVAKEKLGQAFSVIHRAQIGAVNIILPVDHIVSNGPGAKAKTKTVSNTAFPDKWTGADLGPKTIGEFGGEILRARTLLIAGSFRVLDSPKWEKGTGKIGRNLSKFRGKMIVAGIEAWNHYGPYMDINSNPCLCAGETSVLHYLAFHKCKGVETGDEEP